VIDAYPQRTGSIQLLQKFSEPRRVVQYNVGQKKGRQRQKKQDEVDGYNAGAQ
jgi:hypothetical protein